MEDSRNVTDEFKGMPHDEIVAALNNRGIKLEIAMENLSRDFNMGTIVRSANAFGVRKVHVISSRQWNKRGAMMTDKYLQVVYHKSVDNFANRMKSVQQKIIAVDNTEGSISLTQTKLPENCVLVFGAEGPGLSTK